MVHANVKIITLSEGEVTHLHVGLNGTMNALFLKDLADKTRRGLRGRVELGKSGGGNSMAMTSSSDFRKMVSQSEATASSTPKKPT